MTKGPNPQHMPKGHGRKPSKPRSQAKAKSCPLELVVLVPVVIAGLLIQAAFRFAQKHIVASFVALAFVATGMLMASCQPQEPQPMKTIECKDQVCR